MSCKNIAVVLLAAPLWLLLGGCAHQYFRVDPAIKHSTISTYNNSEKIVPIDLDTDPYKTLYARASGTIAAQALTQTGTNIGTPKKEPSAEPTTAALVASIDKTIDPSIAALNDAGSTEKAAPLASTGSSLDQQIARNALQDKMLALSDAICEQHKGDILATSAQTNLFAGIGSTLLSGAAAIVSAGAASSYAAGATLLGGSRAVVSSELYQGLLTHSIVKAIEESRERKRTDIQAKRGETVLSYSVDQAIIDSQDYHFRCSFYHGVVVLSEDPAKRARPSRADIVGRISTLRNELTENSKQPGVTPEEMAVTKKRIQIGIDALYDQLNNTN